MLYIEKLRKLSGLSYNKIAIMIGRNKQNTICKFKKRNDFKIDELVILRDKFAEMGLISVDFDIGDLLNEVEEDIETNETALP